MKLGCFLFGMVSYLVGFCYDQCRHRSETPIPCPPVYGKVLELRRSHSHPTNDANRTFLAADLLIGDVLGQGFFGQAVMATHAKSGQQLVLKHLLSHDEHADNGFLREILILRSLSHPCLLKYVGVLYMENALNLVTEFIEGGSLSSVLLDLTVPLSWKQRISFARDIAAGMGYLHSVGVIHRDLNSHNCLVRKDHTVVVADLGLAKVIPHPNLLDCHLLLDIPSKEEEPGDGASTARGRKKRKVSHQQYGGVVGNPYWMAPEMMRKGIYDEKADVFSYGIILCETIARVTADPDYMPRSMDFSLNVEAFHELFCEDAPEPYFMLAVLCSQLESENRPSFERAHLMCESLILHVEHAAAVPRDLRGSTIDFHQKLKEKGHGKGCKDIDNSVCFCDIPKQHQDIFTCQEHDNQLAKENSFQTIDLELSSSHTYICSLNECNDICSATGITRDDDKRTRIRQTANNSLLGTRQPKCGSEIVHDSNGQNQLIENCNKENIHRTNRQNRFTNNDKEIVHGTNGQNRLFKNREKEFAGMCILSRSVVSATRPVSTRHRDFTSQSGASFRDNATIFHSENINQNTQSGKIDRLLESITFSSHADDAYFSSSSTPSSSLSSSSSSSSSWCLPSSLLGEYCNAHQNSQDPLQVYHKAPETAINDSTHSYGSHGSEVG